MAVGDWADFGRWFIEWNPGDPKPWQVSPSDDCEDRGCSYHSTFAEAHAAYLDAVTCEALTPFAYYTEPRCDRARGHEGAHRFMSKNPENAPLHVNQK